MRCKDLLPCAGISPASLEDAVSVPGKPHVTIFPLGTSLIDGTKTTGVLARLGTWPMGLQAMRGGEIEGSEARAPGIQVQECSVPQFPHLYN